MMQSRQKRRCSSLRNICSTVQSIPIVDQCHTKSSLPQHSQPLITSQGLQEDFNKRFDNTLSMLANSMQMSQISRTLILHHQNQEETEIRVQTTTPILSRSFF